MSAGKLQDKLYPESKKLWSARAVKDQVVLMDWNCAEAFPPENSTINILLNILQNVNMNIDLKFYILIKFFKFNSLVGS